MSNIYIQEPPTSGKVLIKTTAGDIDIELWARETPKACRNFIQLCMEGYYDGTIFHRLVKEFIVQGGDPNGDGTGGTSIYGESFKDEFHSRLRFTRRGLVAMANSGKNSNGSQFFFTLGPTPELQNKHTIFGKVTGDTLYNMLKLEEGLVGEDERPHYPYKILKAEILHNPFDDIVPRIDQSKGKGEKIKNRKKEEKGVKNFGLLSFGIEAEEDEEETTKFIQKITTKGKSTHDVLDDPKLSRETYKVDKKQSSSQKDIEEYEMVDHENDGGSTAEKKAEKIREKLKIRAIESKSKNTKDKVKDLPPVEKDKSSDSDSDQDYLNDVDKEKKLKKEKQVEEIKQQINSLKRAYKDDRKVKSEAVDRERAEIEDKNRRTDLFKEYLHEKDKYSKLKEMPKKGKSREELTLQLLSKFKSKLETVKHTATETVGGSSTSKSVTKAPDEDGDDDLASDTWMSHKLEFQEQGAVLAKDAATKKDDWYDVYDPRNPLNKRRRGDTKEHHRKDHSRSGRR